MNREDAAESAPWLLPADDPRHECNFRGDTCEGCGAVDEEFRALMAQRFDVWMQVPGSKQGGWSKVAAAVHKGEADVWERTSLHRIHVEESKS